DHAAAAIAAAGIPVFAVKGETLTEYWDYTARMFDWHGGGTPNMILDDGGDATMLVHAGVRAEQGDTAFLDKPASEEEEIFYALIKRLLKEKPKGWFAEIDPICALQATMEGYEVVTMEMAAPRADIFVTATGNKDIITIEHMREMKDRAIVCNIGHFDNEIQVASLRNLKWTNIKPQV